MTQRYCRSPLLEAHRLTIVLTALCCGGVYGEADTKFYVPIEVGEWRASWCCAKPSNFLPVNTDQQTLPHVDSHYRRESGTTASTSAGAQATNENENATRDDGAITDVHNLHAQHHASRTLTASDIDTTGRSMLDVHSAVHNGKAKQDCFLIVGGSNPEGSNADNIEDPKVHRRFQCSASSRYFRNKRKQCQAGVAIVYVVASFEYKLKYFGWFNNRPANTVVAFCDGQGTKMKRIAKHVYIISQHKYGQLLPQAIHIDLSHFKPQVHWTLRLTTGAIDADGDGQTEFGRDEDDDGYTTDPEPLILKMKYTPHKPKQYVLDFSDNKYLKEMATGDRISHRWHLYITLESVSRSKQQLSLEVREQPEDKIGDVAHIAPAFGNFGGQAETEDMAVYTINTLKVKSKWIKLGVVGDSTA